MTIFSVFFSHSDATVAIYRYTQALRHVPGHLGTLCAVLAHIRLPRRTGVCVYLFVPSAAVLHDLGVVRSSAVAHAAQLWRTAARQGAPVAAALPELGTADERR